MKIEMGEDERREREKIGYRLNIERWVLCLTYSDYKKRKREKSRTKKK
jgi:hypothetical protein